MQTIITKYLPPTTTRPSRIKASCRAGSVTLSWDYGGGQEDNHDRAAAALITKLGWVPSRGYPRGWQNGKLPGGGRVYVYLGSFEMPLIVNG